MVQRSIVQMDHAAAMAEQIVSNARRIRLNVYAGDITPGDRLLLSCTVTTNTLIWNTGTSHSFDTDPKPFTIA